jgi:hypothetical protein
LSFGDENKQNVTGKTYFWVIPVVPVSIALGTVLLFLLSIVWFIRRYIRRALELEQKRYGISPGTASVAPKVTPSMVETLIEPVREGVVDLRAAARLKQSHASTPVRVAAPAPEPQSISMGQLLRKYRLFLIFVVVLIGGCVGAWMYFHQVLVVKKGFQITNVHIQAESVPKAPLSPQN